ncbi:unnamed protein product [Urochloa humidicola]
MLSLWLVLFQHLRPHSPAVCSLTRSKQWRVVSPPRPSQRASKFTLASSNEPHHHLTCHAHLELRLRGYWRRSVWSSTRSPIPIPIPCSHYSCAPARIGDACWCCGYAWIFRSSLGLVKVLAGEVADKLEEYFRTMYKKACFLVSVRRPALPWLGHRTRQYPFRFG